MALHDNSTAPAYSPQQVAAAFVNQYYQTLRNSPEHVHLFYTDSSTLSREDSNGNMTSVTTMHGINAQIMSTDYVGYLIELHTVDTQASYVGGVLILVTGSFTSPEAVKKFTQSFFLAPQGKGAYFILNDMFRFVSAMPSTVIDEALANHDNESTEGVTLPAESASAAESTVPASLPINDVVASPTANGVAPVKNDAGVEACTNAVKNVEMPEAASTPTPAVKGATTPAPVEKVATASAEKAAPTTASAEKAAPTTASAEKAAKSPAEKVAPASAATKDGTKKTYASIVSDMRVSAPPAPVSTVKTKPRPHPRAAPNVEKPATSPKHAQAINTAPSDKKNIPKSKTSDEPGYSIFVKNLPYNATVLMVEQEFKKFGAIKPGGIQVRNRQFDGFCFGFVEFESQHSMQEALEAGTVYFGTIESYIEEKRTTTRVVNGVVTRGDDKGSADGSRFQSGRGGYQGANFRGWGDGYGNNGTYRDGDKMRNGYRNQNDSGRGQGPQGNGYYQNKNGGYHENGHGYHQNGHAKNVNQQRRPVNNSNGANVVVAVKS